MANGVDARFECLDPRGKERKLALLLEGEPGGATGRPYSRGL
jgi:hypothetical protein